MTIGNNKDVHCSFLVAFLVIVFQICHEEDFYCSRKRKYLIENVYEKHLGGHSLKKFEINNGIFFIPSRI